MRLIAAFIRHGDYQQLADTPSAHQPYPLNENGVSQSSNAADQLYRYITDSGLDLSPVIDSSHLLRAWQTAQIISDRLKQQGHGEPKLECFDVLAERGVGSCVANLTLSQIEAVIDQDPRLAAPPSNWKTNSQYSLPFHGAESLLAAGQRVARHITQRMEQLTHSCTTDSLKVFVGHGAAFRHAAYHLGILDFENIAKLSMFHAQPIYIEYLPDNGWLHIAGEWKVRNDPAKSMD